MPSIRNMPAWRRNLITAWFTQILSLTGFGFVFPFMPFFIQDLGVVDPDEVRFWTGLISAAPALSMGVMAPIWGMIADRLGRKLMLLRAMLAGSLVVLGMSLAQSVEMLAVLRVIQGGLTGTMTASATLVAVGTPREKLSSALGFMTSSNFIGISLGPLIGGVVSEYFGYRTAFVIGSIILFFGFWMVMLFIRDITVDEPDEASDGERNASPFGLRTFLRP